MNLDKPNSLISLDFSKAFDRVDWKFLFQLLRKVGFPQKLITIIEEFYRKTKASVVINGYVTSELKIERGVKQGCPLSALLFILCLEPLLERLETSTKLSKIPKKSISYADDVTIFVEDNEVNSFFQLSSIFVLVHNSN